jgi:ribosomal protein L37E
MDNVKEYDMVIVGAGLSGLTSAYYLKKSKPDLNILVIERSGTAGGLTGNWIDHRCGPDKKFQTPMHMAFREKFPNLINLVNEIGGEMSPIHTGYNILTSDGKRHRLEMQDWAARNLPPPFHGLGLLLKLKLPIRAKWDFSKLVLVSAYCGREIIKGIPEPSLLPNTLSLEGLELLLRMGPKARDFMETITPSILNSHPWYTSAIRMEAVLAGTLAMTRNSLHYHIFSKNYNAAFIDRFVERLRAMGVEFRFWTEARRIECDKSGKTVDSIWCKSFGPQIEGSSRYVCENCGAENYSMDRAFCTRCGLDTTLSKIRSGKIRRPVDRELWIEPQGNGYERIRCKKLITAMYPHMIAKLIPIDSPLRAHPVVRAFFSLRGNQTRLSIARVYYKEQVTRGETDITGTHNPTYSFNGCQSVYNAFGGPDLGHHQGDVIDVLSDVGIIHDAISHEIQSQRIVSDLQRVYPDADPSLVEHVSYADIYPDVLYLSDQPAIAGLHRFFNTNRTGISNWYVAGCHSGLIGIGMESAIQGAMVTVNCILEDMGLPMRIEISPYMMHQCCRMAALLGKALLWWRGRGKAINRYAENSYSMPHKRPCVTEQN